MALGGKAIVDSCTLFGSQTKRWKEIHHCELFVDSGVCFAFGMICWGLEADEIPEYSSLELTCP